VFAAECLEMVEHSRTGAEAAGEDAVMQDVLAQWRGFQCPEGVNGAFPQGASRVDAPPFCAAGPSGVTAGFDNPGTRVEVHTAVGAVGVESGA
jgi:hypothetical protein